MTSRELPRVYFGAMPDGAPIERYTLMNAGGMTVSFLSYGGVIQSIRVPDRAGVFADVTPGYETLEAYRRDPNYFGALIGRVANRIAGAQFVLDGHLVRLTANEGQNQLHGGSGGFQKVVWRVSPFARDDRSGALLTYRSVAGEQGFPGTVDVRVTYTLDDDNVFTVEYAATSDAPTPLNLTQHAYFNLAGHHAGEVLDHELFLRASRYTPVNEHLIPTGELLDVAGSPFDFTRQRAIRTVIGRDDPQLRLAGGFDHNWMLDAAGSPRPLIAARLYDPASGRVLELQTTEPGIQCYTGNALGAGPRGKQGAEYGRRSSLALETQHFPDSPNVSHFPSTILRPGETYRSRTSYRFLVAG